MRKPSSINPHVVSNRLFDYRQKQKFYYDQNAKEREQCQPGHSVRIHTPDGWKPAEYIKHSSEPRSHIVKAGPSARLYRRNNSMLMKTREDPHVVQENRETGSKLVFTGSTYEIAECTDRKAVHYQQSYTVRQRNYSKRSDTAADNYKIWQSYS